MIKFAYTILYVENVKETVQFYEKAFGLELKFIAPGDDYAEMITGQTTLSFATHQLIRPQMPADYQKSDTGNSPFGMELGFVVDDVPKAVAHALQNGATLWSDAQQKPWGQTVAYLRDCNGFLIEICTAMSAD